MAYCKWVIEWSNRLPREISSRVQAKKATKNLGRGTCPVKRYRATSDVTVRPRGLLPVLRLATQCHDLAPGVFDSMAIVVLDDDDGDDDVESWTYHCLPLCLC